jgi:hypothetical protein
MLAAIQALKEQGHEVGYGTASDGYLVIAQHPKTGAKLSIRPLVDYTDKGVTVQLRVRISPVGPSQTVEKENGSTTKHFPDHEKWADSYDFIKWSRTDSNRCAVEIVAVSPRPGPDAWAAAGDFTEAGTFNKFAEFFEDGVPYSHRRISTATLGEALAAAFSELLKTYTPVTHSKEHLQQNVDYLKKQIENYRTKLAGYEITLANIDKTVAELTAQLKPVTVSGVAFYADAMDGLPDVAASTNADANDAED